jgi:hypothetical protein
MHPRTTRRTWQPINARLHSASPRPTFPTPHTQTPAALFLLNLRFPFTFCAKINRHTLGYSPARENRRSHNSFAYSASFASSASFSPCNDFLISTVPRLEIGVTHSYKRRKDFLTATRNGFSATGFQSFTNHESRAACHVPGIPEMKLDCVSNGHAPWTICVRIMELARIVKVSGVRPGTVFYE